MSLITRIEHLATRLGGECKSIWAAIGAREPAFTKQTAFNKDFGNQSGTVCQGDDARLSDSRMPTDTSVTYGKLAPDLTSRNLVSAADIDWNAGGVFAKTVTGATTFTFSNLRLNKVITLVMTGDYAITLPGYCRKISGTYDGTRLNYLQLHCTSATVGSEEVWFVISQQAA